MQIILKNHAAWVLNWQSAVQQAFGSGTEKSATTNSTKQVVENAKRKILEADGSLKNNLLPIGAVSHMVSMAIQTSQELLDDKTPLGAAIVGIASLPESQPKERKPRSSTALRKAFTNPQRRKAEKICPNCGSKNLKDLKKIAQQLLAAHEQLIKLQPREGTAYLCQDCGEVFIPTDRETQYPVIPTGKLSTDLAVDACYAMYQGIPPYRIMRNLQKECNLGNNTLSYTIHYLVRDYFYPLYQSIHNELLHAPVLQSDETHLDVLQAQGRGNMPRPQKEDDIEDAVEVPEQAEEQIEDPDDDDDEADGKNSGDDVRQKNYITVIRTPFYSSNPLIYFNFTNERTSNKLYEILKGANFKGFVSDAMSGYKKLLSRDEFKKVIHQYCIAHFRRKLVSAMNAKKFLKELTTNTTPEEQMTFLANAVKARTPKSIAALILRGISQLYANEASVERRENEPESAWLERIRVMRTEKSAPVMADIKTLLLALGANCTSWDGCKYRATGTNAFRYAAAYGMNCLPGLDAFLKDPRIPLDNNASETSLKTVALLRKACNFKQNPEYTQDMCVIFSVFATLDAAEIGNPTALLKDYCWAAANYAERRALTEEYKNHAKVPNRFTYRVADFLQGFDITPWTAWAD